MWGKGRSILGEMARALIRPSLSPNFPPRPRTQSPSLPPLPQRTSPASNNKKDDGPTFAREPDVVGAKGASYRRSLDGRPRSGGPGDGIYHRGTDRRISDPETLSHTSDDGDGMRQRPRSAGSHRACDEQQPGSPGSSSLRSSRDRAFTTGDLETFGEILSSSAPGRSGSGSLSSMPPPSTAAGGGNGGGMGMHRTPSISFTDAKLTPEENPMPQSVPPPIYGDQGNIGEKHVLVMVGLPARGKTHMAKRLCQYLRFFHGARTQVFNVGSYRRKMTTTSSTQSADYFNHSDKVGRCRLTSG